jgi:hypothetical protein
MVNAVASANFNPEIKSMFKDPWREKESVIQKGFRARQAEHAEDQRLLKEEMKDTEKPVDS